ncbi:MAG: hypothetical protein IT427_03715, partial [Pirellulales bacterium]|nr:hypothetical protein [Pirellulales bacterium]
MRNRALLVMVVFSLASGTSSAFAIEADAVGLRSAAEIDRVTREIEVRQEKMHVLQENTPEWNRLADEIARLQSKLPSEKPAAPPTSATAVIATAQPILHLTNGDVAPGELRDSADPSILRWQCDIFTKPLDFKISNVSAVHFPQLKQPPTAVGEYGFEVVGGDILFGSLLTLNDREVGIDSPSFGKLTLRRDYVRRLLRWEDAAGFVYVGPSGLSGWKEPAVANPPTTGPVAEKNRLAPNQLGPDQLGMGPSDSTVQSNQPAQWWQESGHAVTDRPGASIYNNVGLPAKAAIEVEISWKNKADFVLSLGDDDRSNKMAQAAKVLSWLGAGRLAPAAEQKSPAKLETADRVGPAFRIEVLGANIILMRDLGATADLVLLENLGPGGGRVHWHIYLDQERGRAAVYSATGKFLNELTLDSNNNLTKFATGVRLINKRGDVRLERLRVSRWNGEQPKQVDGEKSRIHKADGTLLYGEVIGYDPERQQFSISENQLGAAAKRRETRLDANQVASLVLSRAEFSPQVAISASLQNGLRVSGNLVGVEGGNVKLTSPAIIEPISIPIAQLHSLLTMNPSSTQHDVSRQPGGKKPQVDAGRIGLLEVDALQLHGELADGQASGDATSLVWKPNG